jgi:hypothetical protein
MLLRFYETNHDDHKPIKIFFTYGAVIPDFILCSFVRHQKFTEKVSANINFDRQCDLNVRL